MNILNKTLSPHVDLSHMGIETARSKTVADVIGLLIDRRNKNPGNPDSKIEAEKIGNSIILPLRILLRQQTFNPLDERASSIRFTQAIESLVGDILFVGFYDEDKVSARLSEALRKRVKVIIPKHNTRELVEV